MATHLESVQNRGQRGVLDPHGTFMGMVVVQGLQPLGQRRRVNACDDPRPLALSVWIGLRRHEGSTSTLQPPSDSVPRRGLYGSPARDIGVVLTVAEHRRATSTILTLKRAPGEKSRPGASCPIVWWPITGPRPTRAAGRRQRAEQGCPRGSAASARGGCDARLCAIR